MTQSADIDKDEGYDSEGVVWSIPIEKAEERIVEGVVLSPDTVDAHGDIIKSKVIEEAAANFLAKYNSTTKLGVQHAVFTKAFQLRQSYIAKANTTLNGRKVKKGSWIIQVKVLDDAIWKKIKSKKITGFSIGGKAKAKKLEQK